MSGAALRNPVLVQPRQATRIGHGALPGGGRVARSRAGARGRCRRKASLDASGRPRPGRPRRLGRHLRVPVYAEPPTAAGPAVDSGGGVPRSLGGGHPRGAGERQVVRWRQVHGWAHCLSSRRRERVRATCDGTRLLRLSAPSPDAPAKRRDAHLPRIEAPMLFLHGTRDPFGNPEEMRALASTLPSSQLQLIEGGDHSLQRSRRWESVDEAVERARDWILNM